MQYKAGIQILLLVISVVIVFSVIKPKFAEISYYQNEMVTYQTALDSIGRYNQRLQSLINEAESMSYENRSRLTRYLPESIDSVAVARDIENIVVNNRLILLEVSASESVSVASEPDEQASMSEPVPMNGEYDEMGYEPNGFNAEFADTSTNRPSGSLIAQSFKLSALGTYDQMKDFLRDLERNAYPLQVKEFGFDVEETGPLLQYELLLETYAYTGVSNR